MKTKMWFALGGLLALVLLIWAFSPKPVEVELATVTQGHFERSVQEDGKTSLRDRYVVSTPLSGRVARIDLKQGDTVQRDDALATLWPLAPALLDERTRAEQQAHIGAMEASVARAGATVERAKAALAQARADFKRSEMLAQQGFLSPNQNETDKLTVHLRDKELEVAQQEEDAARHELQQSRVALRQFTQDPQGKSQRSWIIKAPVSGKVLKVTQQSEGMVPAGTPLLELGDPSRLEVAVDILTEDAAQVSPGAIARLSDWGGPDSLEGRVRLIEPAAFTKVSALGVEEQRVKVIIDIISPPEQWRTLGDGFKVDVQILVQTVENAVQVPVSALFPAGMRSALFVLEDGHARQREIEVAARNGATAWVKTGLTSGMQVIVYPPSALKDGARVKAR
ncbi:MAG: efflux RND transporter periplasmic adaptor subunit [Gammaproteobacteria bacterium]|nr:efflux RND transporter periplasmic adaptor subunit [Gammaproteobacteria bacterium]MBU0786646.1 efflux RND transporter periplasmic adaptor subunit [Gammaproteobacteria bacterium]MBU0814283.1 efflux RND transporter periplasmic adaptor subunit [Gammaproteobacteria bacterium]MBU1786197.1 efflux RND transporter periplasmic adaptor subunit [Gammaproteobacteria bacterium]